VPYPVRALKSSLLGAHGCLIFSGILLTLGHRNRGNSIWSALRGFLCKRIPTQIVANTHTNIHIGLFSRKRAQTSNLRHTTAVDNRRRRSSLFISGQVGSVMAVEHVHRGHCLCAAVSLIRSQVVLTKSRNVHAYLFNRLAHFVFHSSFFIEKWKEILCLRLIIYLVYLIKNDIFI